MAEHIQEVFWLTSADRQQLLHVSPAFETIWGRSCESLYAYPGGYLNLLVDSIHPEDRERVVASLTAQSQEEYKQEYRIVQPDGSIRWVRSRSFPTKNQWGETTGIAGLSEDITERKQAEDELKTTRRFLSSLLENLPVGVFVKEPEHLHYVFWNKTMAQLTGISSEDAIGQSDYDFFPTEQANRCAAQDREALSSGKLIDIPVEPVQTTHLGQRMFHVKKIPIYDEAGSSQYLLAIAEDITEHQQALEALRQSEERLRAIIEGQTELICRFKPDGNLTFVNDAYCRYFSKEHYELIGDSFIPLIPEEDQETVTQSFNSLCVTQPIGICEHRVILPSGEIRWQQWTNRAMFDEENNLTEYQAVGRDITQLKQAEAEIRNALTKERELNELRSSFISLVSHEFRTPLTAIQTSNHLLERYYDKLSEEKKQSYHASIKQAVSRMTQLLEDVLTIGRAEAGKLEFEPEPIDLVGLCRELVESFQVSAGQKHTLTFMSCDDSTDAEMDEKLLRHILTHLLSNAIKYSPQGGSVQVALDCTDSSAVLRVQDGGIGIPEGNLERLFESFGRASNVGNIQGTGLGLAIVKTSVDLHGGEIAVDSTVGMGTTFTITLPLKPQSP